MQLVRGWDLDGVPLAAIALGLLGDMVVDAVRPSTYALQHPDPVSVDELASCVTVLVVEALGLIAILRAQPTASLTRRALVLAGAMWMIVLVVGEQARYEDSTIRHLVVWHAAASVWLVLVACASCTITVVRGYAR